MSAFSSNFWPDLQKLGMDGFWGFQLPISILQARESLRCKSCDQRIRLENIVLLLVPTGHGTWFEPVRVCKPGLRLCLTITVLATETAPRQKTYFKNDSLCFTFKTKACKPHGSREQQHMLLIMIAIREFNLAEGRAGGPARGSTKALKTAEKTGPFGLAIPGKWQELDCGKLCWCHARFWEKCCVGRKRDADKQSSLGNCSPCGLKGPLTKASPVPVWTFKQSQPLASAPSEQQGSDHGEGFQPLQFSPTLIPYRISGFQARVCKSWNLSSHGAWFGQLK